MLCCLHHYNFETHAAKLNGVSQSYLIPLFILVSIDAYLSVEVIMEFDNVPGLVSRMQFLILVVLNNGLVVQPVIACNYYYFMVTVFFKKYSCHVREAAFSSGHMRRQG